jgi:hypothetical protein
VNTPPPYRHAEAYCLMTYTADDGSEQETVWNSRDGVTPFVITLRSGKTASHLNWQADRRVPDHIPEPGSRMFVDLTPQRAREKAEAQARYWFDSPGELGELARTRYGTVEIMANRMAADMLRHAGAPDLVEVPG